MNLNINQQKLFKQKHREKVSKKMQEEIIQKSLNIVNPSNNMTNLNSRRKRKRVEKIFETNNSNFLKN